MYEALGRPAWAHPPPNTAVYTPCDLYHLLGPSAAECIKRAGRVKSPNGPDHDFEFLYTPPNLMIDWDDVYRALAYSIPPRTQDSCLELSALLFASNAHEPNPSGRPCFRYEVPTLFLRRQLSRLLRSLPAPKQLHWASAFGQHPAIAAVFIEPLMLELLEKTEDGYMCHIAHGDRAAFRLGPHLTLCHRVVDPADAAAWPKEVEDDTIYVLPSGFAGCTAVVVSEGRSRATLLRLTTGRSDELDVEGMRAVVDAFDMVLPDARDVKWTLSYVSQGAGSRTVAESSGQRGWLGELYPRVALGWMEFGDDEGRSEIHAAGPNGLVVVSSHKSSPAACDGAKSFPGLVRRGADL